MCTKFFASGEVTEKSKLGKAAGQECHQKYVCIDIPDDVKQIIQNNPKLRSYQLWKKILKSHPDPAFSQKAVYNLCAKQNQSEWRRTENELESAKILLAEFTKDSSGNYLPLFTLQHTALSGGCIALAFAQPPLIRKWAGTIREVALDSTFNTTKAGYECFALLGEVFGSGLPKEQYIRRFIRRFIDHWSLEIIQSLSDKDITEINALLAELPDDIKHQVCFWHSIRITFAEFHWIDRIFIPLGQLDPELQTPAC
ncbi:hypothetical protein R3P38DRAFT_3332864 [Favolaschia claudopus]|uniref:MULE transposase domain-containing protein n=1 Tax=Favolaschia claudopus TaxID=2862362 RepID=A0AAV9ZJC6_9AGAR